MAAPKGRERRGRRNSTGMRGPNRQAASLEIREAGYLGREPMIA
jgi:hypothetical protein